MIPLMYNWNLLSKICTRGYVDIVTYNPEIDIPILTAGMSDKEVLEFLLIDQAMESAELDFPTTPDATIAKKARAATDAIAIAFRDELQLPPNVRIVNFGSR